MGTEILSLSLGLNLIQFAMWLRERKLRITEKKKFTSYLKLLDRRIDKLEKSNSRKDFK